MNRRNDNDFNYNRNYLLRIQPFCYKCESNDRLECHHLIPYSISFDSSLENLIIVCYKCHREIHSRKQYNQLEFNFSFNVDKYTQLKFKFGNRKKIYKQRFLFGEDNPLSKLTNKQAVEIKELIDMRKYFNLRQRRMLGLDYNIIAEYYGVSKTYIKKIRDKEKWSWLILEPIDFNIINK